MFSVYGLPPLPGHDEIGIPGAAFGTSQQPRPIENGHSGAVLRDLDSDIGLGAVIAALAPHNEPDVRRERLTQGHRLRLASPASCCHYSGSMPLPELREDAPAGERRGFSLCRHPHLKGVGGCWPLVCTLRRRFARNGPVASRSYDRLKLIAFNAGALTCKCQKTNGCIRSVSFDPLRIG